MKKNITLTILTLLLSVWIPLQSLAADYTLSGTTLTAWTNNATTTVDFTVGELATVTNIAGSAFRDKTALQSVKLSGNITAIGTYAFANCTALTTFDFNGAALSALPEGMLINCAALKTLTLPAALTTVGSNALAKTGLTALTLPNGLTSLGAGALANTAALTAVTLPATLQVLGEGVFNASGITSIDLPAPVTAIPANAFANCSALATVTMGNNVTAIGESAFMNSDLSGSITLSNALQTLGRYVFRSSKIKSVSLPNSVTSMGSEVFQYCNSLTTANIPANPALTTLPDATFYNCPALTAITIPGNITHLGNIAFHGCGLTSVTLPASLTSTSLAVFRFTKLTSVTLPPNLTSLGPGTFDGISTLTAINVDAANPAYTSVGGVLFNKAQSVLVQYPAGKPDAAYTVPAGVTEIGDNAFSFTGYLQSVTLPAGLTTIGVAAFGVCSNLTSVNFPSALTTIKRLAFTDCSKLTVPLIPAGITVLEEGAFTGTANTAFSVDGANPNYKSVDGVIYTKDGALLLQYPPAAPPAAFTAPSTVTRIGERAFMYSRITGITLPNSLTYIGVHAFSYTPLTAIVFPNSLKGDFPLAVCYKCTNLTSVTLPNEITTIVGNCFINSKLTTITIPALVAYIGDQTFTDCTTLTEVLCANPVPPVTNNIFTTSIYGACKLIVPIGSKVAYQSSPYEWKNFLTIEERDFNTEPAFSFNVAAPANTEVTFTLGEKTGTGACNIDWGNGVRVNYPLGTATPVKGKLAGASGATTVKVYGNNMHLLDIAGLPVTEVTTSNIYTAPYLEKLNVSNTRITALDLSKNTHLQEVNCSRSRVASLTMPSSTTAMTKLDVSRNRLHLGTLPAKPANVPEADFVYSPQARIPLQSNYTPPVIDLSAQLPATSVYTWKTETSGKTLAAGTDYQIPGGVTTFLHGQTEPVYCAISNTAFPQLKSYVDASVDAVFRTTATTLGAIRTWMGSKDTNWADAANWDGGTTIPSPIDDIIVASAAINDLQLDTDRAAMSMTNRSGKAIVVPAGKTLTIQGTADFNAPERLLIKARASETENTPNGAVLFSNPAQNTAVPATVEFFTKASTITTGQYPRKWQYFGSPMQNLDAHTPFRGAYVRYFDEASNDNKALWKDVLTGTLTPLTGYEINTPAPALFIFKGLLNTADISRTLATTTGALYPGQHILGNPYAAAVDIYNITMDTGLERAVYLFNTGSMDDWNTNNGNTTPGSMPGTYSSVPLQLAGTAGIPATIPSLQGFLVKTKGANGTITLNYPAVAVKNTEMQRVKTPTHNPNPTFPKGEGESAASINEQTSTDALSSPLGGSRMGVVSGGSRMGAIPYLIIDVLSDNSADRVWLFNEPGTSGAFDDGWDGRKILSPKATQIFAAEKGGYFQVNTNADLENTYIGFTPGTDTRYRLKFNLSGINTKNRPLYILDTKTNTETLIDPVSEYIFSASRADDVKRFKLIAKAPAADTKEQEEPEVYAYGKNVVVKNRSESSAAVVVYDVAGKALLSSEVDAKSEKILPTTLPKGAYAVTLTTAKHKLNKKVIIND